MSEPFNFVIGRPWRKESTLNPGAIAVYRVLNTDVHFGTEDDAVALRKHVEEKEQKPYFVYRLVLVEESQ